MGVVLRRSVPADRAAIIALMERSRRGDLPAQERASRGFVQGVMDEQTVAAMQDSLGVFVAEVDGELAGFVMTSPTDSAAEGPPRLTAEVAKRNRPESRDFLYGPVAVDDRFAGRGLMTRLLTELCTALADYDRGIAFVQADNEKSMAVHRHYGMKEIGDFTFHGNAYQVFAFSPQLFLPESGS